MAEILGLGEAMLTFMGGEKGTDAEVAGGQGEIYCFLWTSAARKMQDRRLGHERPTKRYSGAVTSLSWLVARRSKAAVARVWRGAWG